MRRGGPPGGTVIFFWAQKREGRQTPTWNACSREGKEKENKEEARTQRSSTPSFGRGRGKRGKKKKPSSWPKRGGTHIFRKRKVGQPGETEEKG